VNPTDHDPDADEPDDMQSSGDSEQVRYELHEWPSESRMLLEQLLTGAGLPRAWEGTTLVVSREAQPDVDGLIEHVEVSAESALDPDAERIVYEVGEWTADQLSVLVEALTSAGVGYEFDIEGDLAVLEIDEQRVEEMLDGLEFGLPESAVANGEDIDPDDGIETAEILSDLFVAVDRLQHDATDHAGVLGVVDAVTKLEGRAMPFGYSPSVWDGLVAQAVAFRADLEDGEASDPTIEANALDLRTLLRQYV